MTIMVTATKHFITFKATTPNVTTQQLMDFLSTSALANLQCPNGYHMRLLGHTYETHETGQGYAKLTFKFEHDRL